MPNVSVSRRISAAAKAGALGALALGLFASSPYTNEARAALDLLLNGGATLAFSEAVILPNQFARMCARNYGDAPVKVNFTFSVADINGQTSADSENPVMIGANDRTCLDLVPPFTDTNISRELRANIVLVSPNRCSQATEYPGKCRLVGSLEIMQADLTATSPIRHLEPVLLAAPPGLKPLPLPQ